MDIFSECPRCGRMITIEWVVCPYCMKELEERRLYIKVYADSEPSEKAEKIYQTTPPQELKEIAECLMEYAESEDE